MWLPRGLKLANAVMNMNAEALRNAFCSFNQQSRVLEDSYRLLLNKVTLLSEQLASSQSARYKDLLEKERLANRVARMFEALPGAIIVIDASGTIMERNSKACELLSKPLVGCAWSEVVQREFCSRKIADGGLQLKDGRWLNLAQRRLGNELGEILLLTDITESRNMSELLQRHQRLACIGEMTARLGHQIRTPLASALLYASQLDHSGTPAQSSAAEKVVQRLQDLSILVDDMLRYAGDAKKANETVNVAELLQDVADSVAPQLGDFGQLRVEINNASLVIEANREALKGALLNVVNNAIQACDNTFRIELGAVQSKQQICLTVTDNGHGISDAVRSRLFEPFFTTRPNGTGLGLAVVRSVVEAHDGEVLVDSGPQGTTIAICLPVPATDRQRPEQKNDGTSEERNV